MPHDAAFEKLALTLAQLRRAERRVEPEPSPAQAEAGNYRMGHVRFHGLPVTIETAKGGYRRGVSADGTPWETRMTAAYGYIKRTLSEADEDHVDVFLGDNLDSESVFVVNQVDPGTGGFDEHKAVLGVHTLDEAKGLYLDNYEPGWRGLGSAVHLTIRQFKRWLKDGDTSRPLEDDHTPAEKAAAFRRLVLEKLADLLPGGKADGVPESEFDADALADGKSHEHEHTDSDAVASEIARDHLVESKGLPAGLDYYTLVGGLERLVEELDAATESGEDQRAKEITKDLQPLADAHNAEAATRPDESGVRPADGLASRGGAGPGRVVVPVRVRDRASGVGELAPDAEHAVVRLPESGGPDAGSHETEVQEEGALAGVPGLAGHEGSLHQPEQRRIPGVRGTRDSRVSALVGDLRQLLRRHGVLSGEAHPGQAPGARELHPYELPVGHAGGAGEEHAKERVVDVRRGDQTGDDVGGGTRGRPSDSDAPAHARRDHDSRGGKSAAASGVDASGSAGFATAGAQARGREQDPEGLGRAGGDVGGDADRTPAEGPDPRGSVDDAGELVPSEEETVGAPSGYDYGDLSRLTPGEYDWVGQEHDARRAGRHLDLRLGSPETGLYSWATRKGLPGPGERIGVFQQPVHDHAYGSFEGEIPEGYGAGTVRKAFSDKAHVTKVTPDGVHFTTGSGRYALVRGSRGERGWILVNAKDAPGASWAERRKQALFEPGDDDLDCPAPDLEIRKEAGDSFVKFAAVLARIGGPSGSGKSTLLERLQQEHPGLVVKDLDDLYDDAAVQMGRDPREIPDFSSEELDAMHGHVYQGFDAFMDRHKDRPVVLGGVQADRYFEKYEPEAHYALDTPPVRSAYRAWRRDNRLAGTRPRVRDLLERWQQARRDRKGFLRDSLDAGGPYYWLASHDRISDEIREALAGSATPGASKEAGAVDDLKRAKAHSDRREYDRKHAILRGMLRERPGDFVVDSREGGVVGLTHTRSGFRVHVPARVLPDEFLSKAAGLTAGDATVEGE